MASLRLTRASDLASPRMKRSGSLPDVVIEIGADRYEATARVADEPERTRLLDARIAEMPRFGDYVEMTDRTIPVVVVEKSAS